MVGPGTLLEKASVRGGVGRHSNGGKPRVLHPSVGVWLCRGLHSVSVPPPAASLAAL